MNEYFRARPADVGIGKVIGENEDGTFHLTEGDTFHLTEGDTFLSMIFVKTDGHKGMMPWIPWAEGPVLPRPEAWVCSVCAQSPCLRTPACVATDPEASAS